MTSQSIIPHSTLEACRRNYSHDEAHNVAASVSLLQKHVQEMYAFANMAVTCGHPIERYSSSSYQLSYPSSFAIVDV